MGEGTNIVPINNFEGLVIKNKLKGITEIDDCFVEVSSGENWNEFVKWSLLEGKKGLENLALIPGTVGAGPVQNIGAYGSEISKFIFGARQSCQIRAPVSWGGDRKPPAPCLLSFRGYTHPTPILFTK